MQDKGLTGVMEKGGGQGVGVGRRRLGFVGIPAGRSRRGGEGEWGI